MGNNSTKFVKDYKLANGTYNGFAYKGKLGDLYPHGNGIDKFSDGNANQSDSY